MNQKEEEKLVMSLFRTDCEDFPKGKLIPSESPDFILNVGRHRSIGIELSRLAEEHDTLFERIKISFTKKREKFILYQKKVFSQIWLILYTDVEPDIQPDNSSEILIEMDQHQKFDRVFLFELFNRTIVEIKIT